MKNSCKPGKEKNENGRCVKIKTIKKRRSPRSQDLSPYDSITGERIVDFDITTDMRNVEWRNQRGEVVNMSRDIEGIFDEFKPVAKKSRKNTKWVESPNGGILTIGEDRYQCVKKAKTPTPPRVVHALVARKKGVPRT